MGVGSPVSVKVCLSNKIFSNVAVTHSVSVFAHEELLLQNLTSCAEFSK